MLHIPPNIPSAASQHEILAILARSLPVSSYLEVGVRDGCTVWVVQEAAVHTIRLLALADDWGTEHGGTGRGSHDHIHRLLSAVNYYSNGGGVIWLDGKSQATLPKLRSDRPRLLFDLAHVDGSHDEEPAYQDLVNCWKMLRVGGCLVAHDVRHTPVSNAIDRFRRQAGCKVEIYQGGHGTAVARKER